MLVLLSSTNFQVTTTASVTLADGPLITEISLKNETKCEGLSEEKFRELVQAAKDNCPVGKALASVEKITVDATLL